MYLVRGSYRTIREAEKKASKLRVKNRGKGLGRSMRQHGSGTVKVEKIVIDMK